MNQEQERHGAKSNYFSEPEDTRLWGKVTSKFQHWARTWGPQVTWEHGKSVWRWESACLELAEKERKTGAGLSVWMAPGLMGTAATGEVWAVPGRRPALLCVLQCPPRPKEGLIPIRVDGNFRRRGWEKTGRKWSLGCALESYIGIPGPSYLSFCFLASTRWPGLLYHILPLWCTVAPQAKRQGSKWPWTKTVENNLFLLLFLAVELRASLTKQVLYHSSHTSCSFFFSYFSGRISRLLSRLPWTKIPALSYRCLPSNRGYTHESQCPAKPFILISWLSQIFCHSTRNRANSVH
jgi:hypothetical protein